jgi:UDP-N-acetylmuramyl tripeptide synthase
VFTLPVPGAHNVENALGAIAACVALGVPLADMVAPSRASRAWRDDSSRSVWCAASR